MAQLPPRPARSNLVGKARSAASQIKPPASAAAALKEGRDRVQAALNKFRGIGPHPSGPLFQEFLGTLIEGGEEGEELARQIADRAREELDNRRHLLSPISDLLSPFQSPQARTSFRQDVLFAAKARQVSSQEVWERVDQFFPLLSGTLKVLRFAESHFGPLTIGLGIGVEGGAGVGAEAGLGIAGLRHHCACFFDTGTVAIGTYAEAQAAFQIGVSQGIPEEFWSWGLAIDASLSASYGIAAEATMSLVPVSIQRPSWDSPYLVEYKCVGMGMSIGLGAPGGGVALGVTRTRSLTLTGKAS